jgi:hypothetical protein
MARARDVADAKIGSTIDAVLPTDLLWLTLLDHPQGIELVCVTPSAEPSPTCAGELAATQLEAANADTKGDAPANLAWQADCD